MRLFHFSRLTPFSPGMTVACLGEPTLPSRQAKAEFLAVSAPEQLPVLEPWALTLHSAELHGSESCGRRQLLLGLPSLH